MTPLASSEVLAPGRLSTVAGYSCVVGVSMSRTWLAALSGMLCALLSNASVAVRGLGQLPGQAETALAPFTQAPSTRVAANAGAGISASAS